MPKSKSNNDEGLSSLMDDMNMNPSERRSLSYLPWVLLLLVIIAGAAFLYHQQTEGKKLQQQIMDLKQNPQKATEEETKSLLAKVGALVELPDEQPTVATVTDLSALKDQPFFAHAQVGDKVLIYSQAKKAYLYRPSTNKVIEIAPVNLDSPAANVNTNTSTNTNKTTTPTPPTSTNTNTSTKSTTNTNTKAK